MFLRIFGKPERLMNCDCERTDDTGLMQAFQLINGETLQTMLADGTNRIGRLIDAGRSNTQIVETFWMAALSRHPTPTETKTLDDLEHLLGGLSKHLLPLMHAIGGNPE